MEAVFTEEAVLRAPSLARANTSFVVWSLEIYQTLNQSSQRWYETMPRFRLRGLDCSIPQIIFVESLRYCCTISGGGMGGWGGVEEGRCWLQGHPKKRQRHCYSLSRKRYRLHFASFIIALRKRRNMGFMTWSEILDSLVFLSAFLLQFAQQTRVSYIKFKDRTRLICLCKDCKRFRSFSTTRSGFYLRNVDMIVCGYLTGVLLDLALRHTFVWH